MAHKEGLITFSTRHSSQPSKSEFMISQKGGALKIQRTLHLKSYRPLSDSKLYFLDLYHANVLTCFSQFRYIIAGVEGLRINFKFSFFLFNVFVGAKY